jgi:argininosuccinate synthase
MVYENSDGTLSIYDWKRCKDITTVNYFNKYGLTESVCHLHDTNFWHYALQLNIYKKILEDKYAKVIKDLFLVKLHPESTEENYEIINIPFLENEIIKLCNERMKKV